MSENLAQKLQVAVPGLMVSVETPDLEFYGRDWTSFWKPNPQLVAFPQSIEQVQSIVRFAVENKLPLVPSGGRTGLSGGAMATAGEAVVSFDRMNRVLDLNPVDQTITVEPGVTTAQVQEHAAGNGLFFPVSFASEGSSQIGGNVATNAGGVKVLRYGLTRDWVVGLKVVTGTGDLLDLNAGLVKNATGYDLRHLLIGSEGTLGLVVEVTLALTTPPAEQGVMLIGLNDLAAVMPVFDSMRRDLQLSAFEFFTDKALACVMQEHQLAAPLDSNCPVYILAEFDNDSGSSEDRALSSFEHCSETGWIVDGVISQSRSQADNLWKYRELISESIHRYTPYKNDLSVRVSRVTEFLAELNSLVGENYPDFEVIWFGHIGDGNLHMNVLKPEAFEAADFEQACQEVDKLVFELVEKYQGSISAEHGVGLLKKPWLKHSRSAAEIDLMRATKAAFDPAGILNPGKLLD
jgi:FAD/FMN-containing dehydrogenase